MMEKKTHFLATMKAVFWSFLGIRKKSDYESDAAKLNPVHVIIAGILGAALFIGVLLTIVHFAVRQ
jgi:amino acid transporter